jgi:hypothetical protein
MVDGAAMGRRGDVPIPSLTSHLRGQSFETSKVQRPSTRDLSIIKRQVRGLDLVTLEFLWVLEVGIWRFDPPTFSLNAA